MGERPQGWTVLGTPGGGGLSDAIRAELARDPDRYAPETWSTRPAGICPCCEQEVFRCKTRHTNWDEGFATYANVIHPKVDAKTNLPDPNGTEVGCCCCVAPNMGPKHSEATAPKKRKPKRAAKKR